MELRVNDHVIGQDAIAREAALYAHAPDADAAARRALAARALLVERACQLGLVAGSATGDVPTFASREEEDAVIATVLEREVSTPLPTPEECLRYHTAHPEAFTSGALVEARHILFAVTARTPVMALRERAREVLGELREAPERFAARARDLSNCPSGAQGGNLGQFGRGTMVPEFDAAVFGSDVVGVLPELVATRYGFHVVEIVRRIAGRLLPFEQAQARAAALLTREVEASAMRQYVSVLAGRARLTGVALDVATSPLVQ